jgi:hypothetical protein
MARKRIYSQRKRRFKTSTNPQHIRLLRRHSSLQYLSLADFEMPSCIP